MSSEEIPSNLTRPQTLLKELQKNKMMTLLGAIALVASALVTMSEPTMHGGFVSKSIGDGGAGASIGISKRGSAFHPQAATEEAAMDMAEEAFDGDAERHVEHLTPETSRSRTTMGETLLDSLEKSETLQGTEPYVRGRMLIHSGHVALQSHREDMNTIADKVETLVKEEGQGYVERRSSNKWDVYDRHTISVNPNRQSIDLQLRVSSKKFHDIVKLICSIVEENMVVSVYTSSSDVTDEYIDVSSRADTLDASRKALKLLLTEANNVNDVMQVHRELNRLTQQYESQRSRALSLKKRSDLSSLSVHIEETITRKQEDRSHWWTPALSFWLALEHIGRVLLVLGDTAVYVATWALPCTALLGLLALASKRGAC